ncbi:POL3 protein, partial [Pseudoatta argentina]
MKLITNSQNRFHIPGKKLIATSVGVLDFRALNEKNENRSHSHKTAFTTPFGHYEFDRMLFGLKYAYMDNIVIYATLLEEHENLLIEHNLLIEWLREVILKLQLDKCEFLKTEVTYLCEGTVSQYLDFCKLLILAKYASRTLIDNEIKYLLRSRLKLAEYDYNVVYKARKINVNANALFRNSADFKKEYCNIMTRNISLNPNNLIDAEIISEMLEESDEEKEKDEDFKLHLSDEKPKTYVNFQIQDDSQIQEGGMKDGYNSGKRSEDHDQEENQEEEEEEDQEEDLYFVNKNENRGLKDKLLQKLFERNEIPHLEDLILGKVRTIKYKHALPISEGRRESLTMTFAAEELNLETFSITKTDYLNNVLWSNIKTALQLTFVNSSTKIIICNGLGKYPPKDLHYTIIGEMHCLSTGGHRERYIQQCLQCQLKKLVRVKTKQPMIITDTPGSSFDKVIIDVVRPLPKTEKGNEYILTCMGIPNQTSEKTAEAFVDLFVYKLVFGKIARVPSNELLSSQDKLANNLDHTAIKPGNYVFLLKEPKSDKFGDQYTGPHEVLEILNRYNIKIGIKKNSRIVHSKRLRIFYIKLHLNN